MSALNNLCGRDFDGRNRDRQCHSFTRRYFGSDSFVLTNIISSEVGAEREEIDQDVHLAEYGMDSVMIHQCNTKLEQSLGAISKTLLFEFHTIRDLADHLVKEYPDRLGRLFSREEKGKQIQSITPASRNKTSLHLRRRKKNILTG